MSEIKVGIDIGGTKMLMIAVSDNQTVHKKRIATGKNFSPAKIVNEIEQFLAEINFKEAKIGIAIPGLVDSNGKVVISDVLPKINNWQPQNDLGKYGKTVVLNDGDAALVEVSSIFPDAKSLGVVVVGTGIGAAFMIAGNPLKGEKGWAGEIGYFPVKIGNEFKTLDEVAGGAGILQRFGTNVEEFKTKIEQKDEQAVQIIKEAGANLGANLAGLINTFNFSVLVLTGGTFRWKGYKESVLAEIKRLTIPSFLECCKLEIDMEFENLVINGIIKAIN